MESKGYVRPAVDRVRGRPAVRLGISDRGVVEKGMSAELAIWSPTRIKEWASIGAPFTYATGVQWVFVNGKPVVAEGAVTGEGPGVFIRKR